MDYKYIEANDVLVKCIRDLQSLLDNASCKGPENNEASNKLDYLIEKMEDAKDHLDYLAAEVKEGILYEGTNGKFYIKYKDGSESYQLSCGASLECLYDNTWLFGRVEYAKKDGREGYYFYNYDADNPFLYEGMPVRKRII